MIFLCTGFLAPILGFCNLSITQFILTDHIAIVNDKGKTLVIRYSSSW